MEYMAKPIACQVHPLSAIDFNSDPRIWFQGQNSVGKPAWFIAHADDGVIWGLIRDGQLITSDSAFPSVSPPLRAITLQQARIFGQNAEIRIWRDNAGFKACKLVDQQNNDSESIDEANILWGTQLEGKANGFSLVSDGRQGLRHVIPLDVPDSAFGKYPKKSRPLRLLIRHYLAYDRDGQARVALSRLVNLYVQGE